MEGPRIASSNLKEFLKSSVFLSRCCLQIFNHTPQIHKRRLQTLFRNRKICISSVSLGFSSSGCSGRGREVPALHCVEAAAAAMSDSAERNGDGDVSLKPEGTNSTSENHSSDERAAMKAKINSIWEELKGKDSLPAKVGLPKVQKVSKPNKPSKSVPSWMVSLGLAPPRGSAIQKSGLVNGEKLPNLTSGNPSNGVLKDSEVIIDQTQAEAKGSRTTPLSDLKVEEVLNRLREGADTTTTSIPKASEDSKGSQALRRKSEMQASSSSGLDSLLQQISKKQKPNILDRSRKDWGQFKEEKGLEDELEAYKKSGDKYLDKVAFLQRSDVREYEKERDARLALQSKRSETTPLN